MAKVWKRHQHRGFSSSCFDSLLGLFLEVFWEPKWRPKASKSGPQKGSKIMSQKWSIFGRFWGPIGVLNGAIKGEIRGLKSDLCSSRVPGGVQGSILGGFLMILGPMLWWFWHGFWTSSNTRIYVFDVLASRFWHVLVDIAFLLPSFWTSFWVGVVLSLAWFFTCLLLLKFLLFEGLLTFLVRRWGLSTPRF